jgi:hypothetical protein
LRFKFGRAKELLAERSLSQGLRSPPPAARPAAGVFHKFTSFHRSAFCIFLFVQEPFAQRMTSNDVPGFAVLPLFSDDERGIEGQLP